jgi:hypothetical protein
MFYNNEKLIYEKINQSVFFKALKSKGYNSDILATLFDEENYQTIDKCDFNNTLQYINKTKNFPIFEMLLYLEKNFADLKKVMDVLDDKTKSILKEETKKNFYIKLPECSLSEFFNG